ncbi:MAG: FAD-binding oxidoreductase [Oscillospiraceae bacterium]|nr:FAD-binding oxidoreductase [Oscillospiraceae bacterium]
MKMSETEAGRLRDESRMTGFCDTFSVPSSADELCGTVRKLWEKGVSVTVQGAMTGICGAAVPAGGHIISTEKLNRVLGYRSSGSRTLVTLEPGARLSDLIEYCERNVDRLSGAAFLPDPSEKSATLGGMFSCNAKGSNSPLHGDTSDKVTGLCVLLTNGSVLRLRRGDCVFDKTGCNVPELGRLEIANLPGRGITGKGPAFVHEGCDLIDRLGGSEGMLGIVTELELELEKPAREIWGVMFFFRDSDTALAFAEAARAHFDIENDAGIYLAAEEYFDSASMKLVNEYKKEVTLLKYAPDFPAYAKSAVYLELEGEEFEVVEAELSKLLEVFALYGGGEDDTWAGSDRDEIEKFRRLRHAVPEAVNSELDRIRQSDECVRKLCTDFEIPVLGMREAESLYREALNECGLRALVFGHLLSKRMHFEIIPESFADFEKGRALMTELARRIYELDGTASWENGIGKTKKEIFAAIAGPRYVCAEKIKQFFDGKGLLNPTNML